jgi:hypothetical protein
MIIRTKRRPDHPAIRDVLIAAFQPGPCCRFAFRPAFTAGASPPDP